MLAHLKIELWNPDDPLPPFVKLFRKIDFFKMMASLILSFIKFSSTGFKNMKLWNNHTSHWTNPIWKGGRASLLLRVMTRKMALASSDFSLHTGCKLDGPLGWIRLGFCNTLILRWLVFELSEDDFLLWEAASLFSRLLDESELQVWKSHWI